MHKIGEEYRTDCVWYGEQLFLFDGARELRMAWANVAP